MNSLVEVAPSAARTASHAVRVRNPAARYGLLLINITAGATLSIVVTIRAVDPAGVKTDILASSTLTGTGATRLRVGPGLTAAANAVANDIMPNDIEINFAHGNGNSATYSASLELID